MLRRRAERDAGRLPPWLPGIALWAPAGAPVSVDAASPVCSAKGCRAEAEWVLAWNNPKLHTPDRRKAWTACPAHKESLAQFLSTRGFLRETQPIGEWESSAADR
jgi:hypothetical protein